MPLYLRKILTTVEPLYLVANETALVAVLWESHFKAQFARQNLQDNKQHLILKQAEIELNEYFAGQRRNFDVPINVHGTEFQQKVWQALQTIPFGETRSYAQIAIAIENPKAVRAVGMANRKNLLCIVVPCHRVIGANGQLVGYAGGLQNKKKLLALEQGET